MPPPATVKEQATHRLVARLVVDMHERAVDLRKLLELVLQRLRPATPQNVSPAQAAGGRTVPVPKNLHVVRDKQRRLALHDQVDLDDIPRPVVVHDARIDPLDLVRERHRLVGDQVLEVERRGFPGEVLEVRRAGARPRKDQDKGDDERAGRVLR